MKDIDRKPPRDSKLIRANSPTPKKLLQQTEEHEAHADFVGTLDKETDRGKALITAAYYEELLSKLLWARFEVTGRKLSRIDPLFSGFGPLSTFSAKIGIAYAFSMLSDRAEHNLHLFRKIRNEFAHSVKTKDFSDTKIERYIGSFHGIEAYKNPQGVHGSDLTLHRFSYASGRMSACLHTALITMKNDGLKMEDKEKFLLNVGLI